MASPLLNKNLARPPGIERKIDIALTGACAAFRQSRKGRRRFVTTPVYHRSGPADRQIHSVSSPLGLIDFSEMRLTELVDYLLGTALNVHVY
jgi:hypothetical protein